MPKLLQIKLLKFINTQTLLLLSCLGVVACSGITHKSNNDWPNYGRDYTNQRMSPLTQINPQNVKNLTLAWQFKSGVSATFQATPIVANGVMVVALPYNHVVALDAKTGLELWRYKHERKANWKMCCGPANRGVAVSEGKVFIGTVDARLIALDANTGAKVWDIDVADDTALTENTSSLSKLDAKSQKESYGGTGIGINMAPVVYRGKVIVGVTGVGYGLHVDTPRLDAPLGAVIGVDGRYGRPGFLAAYEVKSGKRVWQFDTIPAQGWEGVFAETTSDGISLNRDIAAEKASLENNKDAWRYGGGSAWSTPAIDPKTNTLFFGTGNPSPQMNDISRPGDNLYTVSLVALDTETGKIKWHYQQVPHDVWGYDLASPPVLFDYEKDGKKIAAVGQASKTGWYYINDRATGQLIMKSDAFVPQKNLFAKATTEGTVLYPGILGGSNWSPSALDEQNQTSFVAGIHAPIKYTLVEEPAKNGLPAIRYASSEPTKDPRWGVLSAINLTTGKMRWQVKTEQPLMGGVLATRGGLVFMGEGDGKLNAYNSNTGNLLWQAKVDAGVNAPPISYEIDGVQYVAVVAGGNAIFGFPAGDNVLVYALGK
ncbi:MAG: PQQ-binding-like beta-propeller repeat protein [Methylotenera sp.]|nr:PQQ-binding-like beta-propeller repeat protein [Methylotenera sp.]MDP2101614.1 PQQ-binding-like beta-propeller repeat protein [Methylotenera sp.]MDP2281697.1 PQQ-binding-like beta-propeller repeat protein [Methylotenera sp.]MDP2402282.1 PQQ-binding-like beta-propeller repeat protein [Methylotenera sp.]MDP3059979.1 PQQ-binding-like beta-propeller repeat protein [Methylotenera sp.]